MSNVTEIKKLRDEAMQAHTKAIEAKQSYDAEKEPEKRAEKHEEFTKAMDDFDAKQKRVNELLAEDKVAEEATTRLEAATDWLNTVKEVPGSDKLGLKNPNVARPDELKEQEEKYTLGMAIRLALGHAQPGDAEIYNAVKVARFATTVTDTTAGGVLVPTAVQAGVDQLVYTSGPMVNPEYINFTDNFTGKLNIPRIAVTGPAGTGKAQGAASSEGTFQPDALSLALVDYSGQFFPLAIGAIEDSPSVSEEIVMEFSGASLGFRLNLDGTTGAGGTGAMEGILNGLPSGRKVVVATRNTLVWNEVRRVVDEVLNPSQRQREKSAVMMHSTFAGALAELTDSNGNYHWYEFRQPTADGMPRFRHGMRVVYNNALTPGLVNGAGSPMVAGDLNTYRVVRGPGGLRIRTDGGTGTDSFVEDTIKFKVFGRYDGGRLHNEAVAALENK